MQLNEKMLVHPLKEVSGYIVSLVLGSIYKKKNNNESL